MFENLVNFFKGKDFLTTVLDDFKVMLNNSENMFQLVSGALIRQEGVSGLKEKIYDLDKTINKNERHIRKKVVEHLVMQPTVDVSACLLLMSVVKDAERLGDYCKNLFEVIDLLKSPLKEDKFAKYFGSMDDEIQKLFAETKQAFMESDEEKAKHSWEVKERLGKECDQIIEKVATGDGLSTNEAVCLALIARHFKRLTSHLINISTSVVLPIHKMDFYDERLKS